MSSPTKIALLVDPLTVLTKGGHHAAGVARELVRRGFAVRTFGAPIGSAIAQEETQGRRERGVLAFQPDLLLAWDAMSPAAWLGARCSRRLQAPLVLFEPGSFAQASLWERTLWRIGESLWGRVVRRQVAGLIATDPVARDHVLSQGFRDDVIEIVPSGVDVERFQPNPPGRWEGGRLVHGRFALYVGRVDVVRGVGVLVDAFASTLARARWSLVIAGSGDARGDLRYVVRRRGVGDRVHFLGKPDSDELAPLIARSSLVAVPALEASVRGIQLARAMACGRPVLASDLPRLAALVEDGRTGLLARPGDVESWSAGLTRMASSPVLRRRLGDEARRTAVESWAWPVIGDRIEAIFERVLAGPLRRAG